MNVDIENISLDGGAHRPEEGRGCVMEWVGVKWLMSHGWTLDDAWQMLTDSPACTDPLIYRAAQTVNDRLARRDQLEGTDELQRLVPLIDRLARCHTPRDPVKANRVRVRVACWAARSVLEQVQPDAREAALGAIETAEAWLRGEASEDDCRRAADAAYVAAYAATAAYAAATTASAAAYAAAVAYAAADAAYAAYAVASAAANAVAADAATAAICAADAGVELVARLDELIEQWEKGQAEEGCLTDEPPIVPTKATW